MKISISMAKDFLYGMRIRPFDIASQPKGHTAFTFPDDVSRDIKKIWKESDYRFGILHYPKKLSDRDIDHYTLTDLNVPDDSELWDKFEKFAINMIEYEIEFDEFVKDFIKPGAELSSQNPLHHLKPVEFFKLLSKQGFGNNLKGLEKWYNQL